MSGTLINAIILAGGKSSRLGKNKALVRIGDKTVIQIMFEKLSTIFKEIYLITNDPIYFKDIPARKIKDIIPDKGPLSGIHAGLKTSRSFHNFVFACDLPLINVNLVKFMLQEATATGQDVIIPIMQDGYRLEPLHAIYSQRCLPHIEKQLRDNDLKVVKFLPKVKVHHIIWKTIKEIDHEEQAFLNINTPEDLEKVKKIYTEQKIKEEIKPEKEKPAQAKEEEKKEPEIHQTKPEESPQEIKAEEPFDNLNKDDFEKIKKLYDEWHDTKPTELEKDKTQKEPATQLEKQQIPSAIPEDDFDEVKKLYEKWQTTDSEEKIESSSIEEEFEKTKKIYDQWQTDAIVEDQEKIKNSSVEEEFEKTKKIYDQWQTTQTTKEKEEKETFSNLTEEDLEQVKKLYNDYSKQ